MNASDANPLLISCELPLFDQILPEHVVPAMDALLAQAEAALEQVTQPAFAAQWQDISRVLDTATERLGRAWGVVHHLNAVADTPQLRAAYNAALPRITEFWTRLGSDERLYAKYKAMDPQTLTAAQKQARHNALRGFVLGGAELKGAARKRFAQIQERLAEITQKFSENTLDATDSFVYYATREELDGVPVDVCNAAREAAQAKGQDGYALTLKLPCYLPVMQFARNAGLRERLYRAYVTRASDQAQGDAARFDNTAIMQEILALRHEQARLLGHAHFAALSLVPKMAESCEKVTHFLRDLAQRARPFAEKDVADLRHFAKQEWGLDDPQPWDWTYVSERLKEARYAFSEEEVKQYFPAPKVLAGLFGVIRNLFGVLLREDTAPVWNKEVRFFRIENADGALLGQCYLDLSARAGKRSGAWMDDARTRWRRPDDGRLQTPVAYVVCNFASGMGGQPPLLTHDDVITLFHEFGHALHHLLTQVDEHDVAGIGGVEWDAVELPSQFMENFCWDWGVLQAMSSHVQSGKPLPRALYEKMLAAKNYQSAMATLRQIEFALFDMLLHGQAPQQSASHVMDVLRAVRSEVAVLPSPAFNRMAHTFSHIFAGGYAAGYYSYKWAEVLSADAYAAFEETLQADGRYSQETGARFRQEILEVGGSRPAMDSFKAFRGREPVLDALLRHQGMVDTAAAHPAQ